MWSETVSYMPGIGYREEHIGWRITLFLENRHCVSLIQLDSWFSLAKMFDLLEANPREISSLCLFMYDFLFYRNYK